MAKGKPRDRIVTIERIYETPKLLSEQDNYNYYSFGIKLTDESYANIILEYKRSALSILPIVAFTWKH